MRILVLIVLSMMVYGWAAPAIAEEAQDAAPAAETQAMATLKFEKPYAFATAASQKNGAVFFSVTNSTGADDRLVSVSSDVAETAELHTHEEVDGVMRMRAVAEGFPVGAGETLSLEPAGHHVMLLGLRAPLEAGKPFNITLTFENAPQITLPVEVIAPGAAPEHGDHGDHGGHEHGHHGE